MLAVFEHVRLDRMTWLLDEIHRVLKPGGRYLTGNPRLSVMLRSIFTTRFTDRTASFAFARETRDELLALKTMIEDGRIGSIVDRVYPMEQAAEAHRLMESSAHIGKIVLEA